MLLLGVTQRSEMRRHINVFVAENFPDVSELDFFILPLRPSVELFNVAGDDSTQADTYRPGACLEACKVQLGINAEMLLGYRVGLKICIHNVHLSCLSIL